MVVISYSVITDVELNLSELKNDEKAKQCKRSSNQFNINVNSAGCVGVCLVQLHHSSLYRFLDFLRYEHRLDHLLAGHRHHLTEKPEEN